MSSDETAAGATPIAPMGDVEGKVAFITGGSSGIGLGIARAFIDAGMKVAITYRTQAHLDSALEHLGSARERIHSIRVDVTDRAGMERAAQETLRLFGKVHVLVNNAGVVHPGTLSNTNYDDWDWVIGVNLTGVFNGVHAFLPHIRAHGEGGHIISTSSILGLFVISGSQAAYKASKFAVIGMMEALRAELAETSIGVSVFCPGMVRSNLIDADRARPTMAADTRCPPDSQAHAQERAAREDSELNLDPLEAGRIVLRGMRSNDLYILTHPEYEQIMRDRDEALLASLPVDASPSAARLALARDGAAKSVYARELARKAVPELRRQQRR
jgi:NAD(P)-dependent dehydrogenase (short-subunit alcohol dehydrogenase family)